MGTISHILLGVGWGHKSEAFGAALIPAQLSPISSGSALLRGARACRYGPR